MDRYDIILGKDPPSPVPFIDNKFIWHGVGVWEGRWAEWCLCRVAGQGLGLFNPLKEDYDEVAVQIF
jgi:hypothetical protein